ncbi:alkaline phosphatase family protein [Schlesneria sp.]|uniref:alkaline phosphatase family protein n=1 Tax=Schlesneria sp. TaxID=2762018 RepID=UPI002F233EF9
MSRVMVLALSEASPELVQQFCDAGVMPNLSRLMKQGLSGHTRYSIPYLLTPQMWATILTGRRAGSHGVFDYWQRQDGGKFLEVHGSDVKGPKLWDVLASNDLPSGWVNVPMTYPPPMIPGFALSGQDAPGAHPSISHPRELFQELTSSLGRYHHKDIFPGGQDKATYGELLPHETVWQKSLLEKLVYRDDWRFLFAYNSGSAFAQHYFWKDMEEKGSVTEKVAEKTFAAADVLIGSLMNALEPTDTLFVISECGAGPIKAGVRLQNWLEQNGFLARTEGCKGPSATARLLTSIRTNAQRYLPRSLFYYANAMPFKQWVLRRIAHDHIDWSRTRAYHRGKGEGNIYINLAGREQHGIVRPEEYEPLRDELITALRKLTDPETGESAVIDVHRREALFGDQGVEMAPDLVIEWRDARYMPAETLSADQEIFSERVREFMTWPTSGSHRPEGLFVAAGPNIRPGKLEKPVELVDLAPTWLHALGCPVPASMNGSPRVDLFQQVQSPAADPAELIAQT